VWTDYLELLLEQKWVTSTRRVFDSALAALPITQHDRVWQLYLVRGPWGGGACCGPLLGRAA
jgi:pre-mRNA-splicing factor SYF1